MYSLDLTGVRAKIIRHLRRHEREPVFVSPYRFALAYLPQLLSTSIKRVLWLHTDVILRADVRELFDTPLDGFPAGGVEDCAHRLRTTLNTSHAAAAGYDPDACIFNSGVLLIDTTQWLILGVASRVEFWMEINLRSSNLYKHDSPLAPLLLALLPIYKRLPRAWNIAGLGRRKLSSEELKAWQRFWQNVGVRYDANPQAPALILTGAAGGIPAAKLLHFSGRFKPWLTPVPSAVRSDGRAVEARCREEPASASASDVRCASLWVPHGDEAAGALGWSRRDVQGAALVAAAAAAAASGTHTSELSAPPLQQEDLSQLPSDGAVHVTIVAEEAAPFGLVAVINSTVAHVSAERLRALHFHVIVPAALQVLTSRKLGRIFPPELLVSVTAAPESRLDKLASRLYAVGIATSPMELPLLWLHLVLPADVHRTLLLPADSLVLTDISELHGVALNGKVAAVFEDCSNLFEVYFNHEHKLFQGHGRATCAFDVSLILLDVRAWRRDDLALKLLELLGLQRRTENLYLSQALAISQTPAVLLLLDKRALRLPARWLARGLARDSWSHLEAAYWHRYWGQQGVHYTYSLRPVRAHHAVASPRRETGDALLLRFSGGVYKPWVRRCDASSAPAAAVCGRRWSDCASLWWQYVAEANVAMIEAHDTDPSGTLLALSTNQRPCVADPTLAAHGAPSKAFDADLAPRGGVTQPVAALAGAGSALRIAIPNSSLARLHSYGKKRKGKRNVPLQIKVPNGIG
uniref:Uncharacterized protein n=1 Tax=Calcidiscus leptoporus TaxID=127549 RepID=A0A6U5JRB2_9EUKA